MASHYYKKIKSDQVEIFCIVVECGCNMTKAAKLLGLSTAAISSKMGSLAKDNGLKLFGKKANQLFLTPKGKAYYKVVKDRPRILLSKTDERMVDLGKIRKLTMIKILAIKIFNFLVKQWNKILIKITIKVAFFFVLFISGCIYFYLEHINYFFDRKLESLANPMLKELMIKGDYKIPETVSCSFEGPQISLDIMKALDSLTDDKKFKNLSVQFFYLSPVPLTSLCMSGDDKIDSFFNDVRRIPCDTQKSYEYLKTMYSRFQSIFAKNKNFKVYNIYYADEKTWPHSEQFFANVRKYPDQIIAKKIEKPSNMPNTKGILIKHGRYYYLQTYTNIRMSAVYEYRKNANKLSESAVQSELEKHKKDITRERHIIWKKLTLNELMHYDNGSYWRLIKDYEIKID